MQEFLYKAIEIANDCDLNYRQSRNKRLLVELALIRLSQLTAEKKNFLEVEKPAIAPVFQTKPADVPQSAPAPQPAVAPAPQPAPVSKTPPQSPLRSFSINSNATATAPKPAENQPAEQTAQAQRDTPFSQNDLSKAWADLAKSIDKEVHIVKFIENAVPVSDGKPVFALKVENNIQEQAIQNTKEDILQFLKNQLQNDSLDFAIQIEESTVQRPLTPQERFNKMLAENESFRKLSAEISLEVV